MQLKIMLHFLFALQSEICVRSDTKVRALTLIEEACQLVQGEASHLPPLAARLMPNLPVGKCHPSQYLLPVFPCQHEQIARLAT